MKIVQRKIDDLIFAEYNPRSLTTDQHKQLGDSLKRFGMAEPIIVNKHKDRADIIIGGHQRARVWKELGNTTIPTVEEKLPLDKEKELNVRLNKNTGEFDFDMLANNFEVDDLKEWGFTDEDLKFETEETQGNIEDDEIPEVKEAFVKKGDIWILGDHRVMCGDSTNGADVSLLMDGEKADMVFTDPPYNVDYGNSNNPRHKSRTIINDKKSTSDWDDFVRGYMTNLLLFTNGNLYISMSDKELGHMQKMFEECGGRWASFIIWVKDRLVLSGKDYHSRHETILYGWNEKIENRLRVEDRKQDDVWEIKRPSTSDLHPTMKPIELIERMLNNSSRSGHLILDLFLGSGSTLIAAEKTNRKCYGMEIDNHYCDVIITRWQDFTGKKAHKQELELA